MAFTAEFAQPDARLVILIVPAAPPGDAERDLPGLQMADEMGAYTSSRVSSIARLRLTVLARLAGGCRTAQRARLLAVAAAGILLVGCSAAFDPQVIEDAQTVARVKTALVNDPVLGGRTIEVRVSAGVVQLSGRVLSPEEAARAGELARSVPGVQDVDSQLQIGIVAPPVEASGPEADRSRVDPGALDFVDEPPRLLAIGGTIARSHPLEAGLSSRLAAGPLLKLGFGRGVGFALGFSWFQTSLALTPAEHHDSISRVHVRPLMGGVSYTFGPENVAVSTSLVAGLAFNSFAAVVPGTARVLVDVSNSFAIRPSISVWHNVARRVAVNVSAGYVKTRMRVTYAEDGRLERRTVRADTPIVTAGLAYWLF